MAALRISTCIIELQAEVVTFFIEHHLIFFKLMTDKPWFSRFGYLADLVIWFSKMNKMSLSF